MNKGASEIQTTKLPKVTIMIPTYNQEVFIRDAIESAMRQDYENLEIVISDDHSQDQTTLVVNRYLEDSRIRYYRNESNMGRVNNYRRTLCIHATGDWVVNLDGDDYFTDNCFISRAMSSIKECSTYNKNIVAYLANQKKTHKFDKKLLIKTPDQKTYLMEGRQYFINYSRIGSFSHMACIYNRNEAVKVDYYQDNYLSADFISFIKLALHGHLILAEYEIGVWRKHTGNVSHKNLLEKYRESIEADELMAKYASGKFSEAEIENWLSKAKKMTHDDLNNDLLFISQGSKQFAYYFRGFRLNYKYLFLFFILVRRNILIYTKKCKITS